MSAFRVGQRVVCIDEAPHGTDNVCHLSNGAIYTIAWIGPWNKWTDVDGGIGVHLSEVRRHIGRDGMVHPYGVNRFRPMAYPSQSLEHDVAQFQNVGTHARTPEKERA